MRIDGSWHLCDDGVLRPVIVALVKTSDNSWLEFRMLVDIGADRTVLSADVLDALGLPKEQANEKLQGVGGKVASVMVNTQIRMTREKNATILFDGRFTAFTDPTALDMSVLGRDITNLFAVIVDRPQDVVCMLGQKHRYVVLED